MLEKQKWTLAEKNRWVESQCHINAIRATKEQIETLFSLLNNVYYQVAGQSGRSRSHLCQRIALKSSPGQISKNHFRMEKHQHLPIA